MLYGCDISNWNRLTYKMMAQADFVIHKATEGRTYKDLSLMDNMGDWYKYCEEENKPCLRGYYHFARPQNGNSVKSELDNFKQVVPCHTHQALIALDIEDGAENYPDWCYQWCKAYYEETGVRPLIYTSQSNIKRFEKCYDFGCGLWVAQYKIYGDLYPETKPDSISPWPFWALWQWSNGIYVPYYNNRYVPGNVDQNIFNGTADAWMKYAKGDNT